MTNIKYAITPRRFLLTAEGHTGYAPHGQDIVCAGISVLLSTLQFSAQNLLKHNELQILRFNLADGKADISLQYDKAKIAAYCIKPFIQGLIAIGNNKHYAEYVSIQQVNVSELEKWE